MKRMPLFLSALLPLFCLGLAVQAEARPVAATLYPVGAMITEEVEAVPSDSRIVLTLPAGADTGTLAVSLSQGGVLSRTTALRPGQAAPAVAALQQEVKKLRDTIALKQAELAGSTAMRQFWAQPPYSLSAPSVEMANSLMETFSRESESKLKELAAREAGGLAELRGLQKRADDLEARIRLLGKQNADVQECVLAVDGTGSGPVTVRWSYWLNDARWAPLYRVSADSSTGKVKICMQAELSQESGMDWNGVELTLASSNRLNSVNPPALRPWVIGQTSYDAAPRVMMSKAALRSNAEAALPAASADEAGLTWSLGRMDLPASATVTRLVGLHELDAKFSRLLRPRQSSEVWFHAALDAEALAAKPALLLPAGQASFLVDGRENARGSFRFSPADRDIFFGIDQLMKAEVNEVAPEGGHTPPAFFSDSETMQWSWISTVSNGHDKTVTLRVEETEPIVRRADAKTRVSSAAKIRVSTTPEAVLESKKARYVWELSVPARQKTEIRCDVTAVIPE